MCNSSSTMQRKKRNARVDKNGGGLEWNVVGRIGLEWFGLIWLDERGNRDCNKDEDGNRDGNKDGNCNGIEDSNSNSIRDNTNDTDPKDITKDNTNTNTNIIITPDIGTAVGIESSEIRTEENKENTNNNVMDLRPIGTYLDKIRYESIKADTNEYKIKKKFSFPTYLTHKQNYGLELGWRRNNEDALGRCTSYGVHLRMSSGDNVERTSHLRYNSDNVERTGHLRMSNYGYNVERTGHLRMYNIDNVERTGIQHGACCAAAGSSLYSCHLVRLKTLPYFKPTPFTIIPSLIHQTSKLTVMLKNIPNKYTSSMLINLLNEDHYGSYDFVYLRMDFLNERNVGYAFINFVHANYLCSFYYKVHGRGWTKYSSNKIAEVTYASIQGIDALYRKFRNSPILHEQESFRPKMFYRDGPFRGIEKNVFEP